MSVNGLSKGTDLEQMIKAAMQAEANGTMMYYSLARLAKEQGMDDAAEAFVELGNQEAVHAGFYAVLNGKYPKNFWGLVRSLQKAECNGETQVKTMADKVRGAGFAEAADQMEVFAKEEGHHGKVLAELLEKYSPEEVDLSGKPIYICKICGYKYIGDINAEADDYVCPLCGQPKTAFVLK